MYNKIFLLGRLGKDPEVRSTQSGKQVATISVATNRFSQDKETTTWFNVVLWDRLVEYTNKLSKGSKIFVEGEMIQREYYTKDNQKRTIYEVNAHKLRMLDNNNQSANNINQNQNNQSFNQNYPPQSFENDLPF